MRIKNSNSMDCLAPPLDMQALVIQPGRLDTLGGPDLGHIASSKVASSARPAGLKSKLKALLPAKRSTPAAGTMLLLQTSGGAFALSEEQGHGYHGVFRVGTDAMRGHQLGVKQLHYHSEDIATTVAVAGAPHVHSQPRSVIINELEMQTRVAALKPWAVVEVQSESQIFVMMSLMQGDLSQIATSLTAAERQPVSWSIFAQAASNTALCHRNACVHRDLKLENILWDKRGSVVVADYGLAVSRDDAGALSHMAGRIFSLPPEVLERRPCTEKIDVWLLAVAMWQMLAPEHRPFETGYVNDASEPDDIRWTRKLGFARGRVPEFLAARAAFLRGEVVVDPTWAVPFEQARRANPEAFDFIMQHMFEPNPAHRIGMDKVETFALEHFHALPQSAKRTCLAAFERLGRTAHKQSRAVLGRLSNMLSRSVGPG